MHRQLLLALVGAAVLGVGTAVAVPTSAPPAPPIAALSAGAPTSLSPAGLAVAEGLAQYGPRPDQARTLDAPGGERWIVMPAANGGACIQVPDGTLVCGAGAGIADGSYGVVSVSPPPASELARQAEERRAIAATGASAGVVSPGPRMPAVRRGLVPDGIATVEALGADGRVLRAAAVEHNAYVLSLGLEGEATHVRLVPAGNGAPVTSALS